ncbi:MAG: amidohydrolase family protein, partial [Ferruginibacter sp.]|nr:amidohydrolase family protein [Ferruginibacter sp.]
MKNSAVSIICSLFIIPSAVFAQQSPDIIITNGKVITLNPENKMAEAIAISGNKIIAVGNTTDLLPLKTVTTKVIDARGKTIIPGLSDNHLHIIRGGRFFNLELRWDGVKTLKRALQMLREQAARTPKGEWVRVVGGWNEYQFIEKRLPTLKEINDATGNVPTFILYLYGKAFVNQAGLKQLSLDANSRNPPMGLIEKDIHGNPTGLLVADPGAFLLYSNLAKLPEHDGKEKIQASRNFMLELNRLGVTSVLDAGGGFQNYPTDYNAMEENAQNGNISLRIPFYLFAQKKGTENQDYTKWVSTIDLDHEQKNMVSNKFGVKGAGENIVSDGADYENFEKPQVILPPTMEENLKPIITLFVQKRWPFRLHATYNESITRFLNVFEEVNKEYPFNKLTWL